VTAALLVPTLRLPPSAPTPQGKSRFQSIVLLLDNLDIQGTVVLIPSIICLLLALQWGGTTESWSSWRCILLLCMFSVLALLWTYMQYRRGDRATVSARIILQRSVAFGSIYSMPAFGASMVMLYYLPIWFQAVRGVSALEAGVSLMPLVIAWAIFLIVSAQIVSQISALERSDTDRNRLPGRAISCRK
jgi:Na+/melibiose symporter-like transporter